jgi:hypothetical protein
MNALFQHVACQSARAPRLLAHLQKQASQAQRVRRLRADAVLAPEVAIAAPRSRFEEAADLLRAGHLWK